MEWAGEAHSAPVGFLSGGARASSFPFVHRHSPLTSSILKARSHSESDGLNRFGYKGCMLNLAYFIPDTCKQVAEEESDLESSDSDSNAGSDCARSLDNFEVFPTPCIVKKNVRFADDCGKDLYCVKVMTEPSDYPPKLHPSVIARYRPEEECEAEAAAHGSNWLAAFHQPASQYMKFRERIATGKVSLENIVLKNDIARMVGTIKVDNMSFEKRVFVRLTTDHWESYRDYPAIFQPCTSKVYDTFSFDIQLPTSQEQSKRVEFCVCFVAGGRGEFWDSNDGANYVLESSDPHASTHLPDQPKPFHSYKTTDDAYNQCCDNWTKFAAWKNLSTDGPYW